MSWSIRSDTFKNQECCCYVAEYIANLLKEPRASQSLLAKPTQLTQKHGKGELWEELTRPLMRRIVEIITKEEKVNWLWIVVGGYKMSSTCLSRFPSPAGLRRSKSVRVKKWVDGELNAFVVFSVAIILFSCNMEYDGKATKDMQPANPLNSCYNALTVRWRLRWFETWI